MISPTAISDCQWNSLLLLLWCWSQRLEPTTPGIWHCRLYLICLLPIKVHRHVLIPHSVINIRTSSPVVVLYRVVTSRPAHLSWLVVIGKAQSVVSSSAKAHPSAHFAPALIEV